MKLYFSSLTGWLILIFLLISPTVYAEQVITISEADTTLTLLAETTSTKKIENAYPGMTLEFSPIKLKNESGSTIAVHLTTDEQIVGQLTLTDRLGKVIPETFEVPPSATYQVTVTGTINKTLGNEQQGHTIQLPITLYFAETTHDNPTAGKLPQTSEAVVFSKVALLVGLLLVIKVFAYKALNRD